MLRPLPGTALQYSIIDLSRQCGEGQAMTLNRRAPHRSAFRWLLDARALALVATTLAGGSTALGQCPGRWVTDFAGGMNGDVLALGVTPGGDIVAGGMFTAAGRANAHYLARWNGASWSGLGSGVANQIQALAVLANGDVVAGGQLQFLNPATGHPDYITHWNGTSWSPMGSGVNNSVRVLAIGADGALEVGGMFTSAGGTDAFAIASWDGTNWSALGTGTELDGGDSGFVFAITTMPNGDVVAGGAFAIAGGIQTGPIARWDGVAWSALGTGVTGASGPGAVYAVAVLPNGDLIAGGEFAQAGDAPASNIARWNGTSWSALGDGISAGPSDASVNALLVMPNGDLIVGGWFTSAGGVNANGIARWDGSSWSALGEGVTGGSVFTIVHSLALLPNGDLVASGRFASAGGVPAQNIARWTTACGAYCDADFNHDGDSGTDADIEAFFACIAGNCCPTCGSADFNGDGDVATDADIESFFRVLAGGTC
jgi:hypothetical protein